MVDRDLLELWPILLGWPAITVALALSAAGILRRQPGWLFVAAVLAVPFALFTATIPWFGWLGMATPLLLAGASIAIRHHHPGIAWSLLAPFAGLSGWLAIAVMTE